MVHKNKQNDEKRRNNREYDDKSLKLRVIYNSLVKREFIQ